MSIQGVVFQNQRVSAEDHAALFQMFISDGIIAGCGISTVRNTLTISSGVFVLAGRLAKIVGSQQITIPDTIKSTTVRLTGVIDLTQIATTEEFGQFSYRIDQLTNGSYPELRKENINTGSGNYYEVEWALVTVDAQSNITNLDVKIGVSKGTGGGNNSLTLNDFEFPSGDYQFEVDGDNWELALINSGSFVLKKDLTGVDIFVVGAGFDGSNNGAAGAGGYYKTYFGDTLKAGTITVSIGQNGGAVSSFGDKAVSDSDPHKNGASTASSSSPRNPGEDGVYAFNEANTLINPGRKYGAGGGSGDLKDYVGGSQVLYQGAAPGVYGGGVGGTENGSRYDGNDPSHERNGRPNSGSGGGSRYRVYEGTDHSGSGGSGIIILRNSRTSE